MKKKILHCFFDLCCFAGFMWLVGTAGSSDLNLIDFDTILKNVGIGLAIMAVGYFGLKLSGADYVF